jgi:hypothetical protein
MVILTIRVSNIVLLHVCPITEQFCALLEQSKRHAQDFVGNYKEIDWR